MWWLFSLAWNESQINKKKVEINQYVGNVQLKMRYLDDEEL